MRQMLLLSLLLFLAALPRAVAAPDNTTDVEEQVRAEAPAPMTRAGQEAVPPVRTAPRITLWGDYRWLYGKGQMQLPSVDEKRNVFLSTRRFRIAPTLHLSDAWSVSGMIEDIRYDKDPAGASHTSDRHLYLSRLYVEYADAHAAKIRAGRYIFTPIEGNVFDKRVEGVRYRRGNKDIGMTSVFYGRTVASRAKERKRGVILGYERNWEKWMGGAFYYDLHSEAPAVTAEEARRNPLALHGGMDRQRVLELFAGYRFGRHSSFELEYLHGRAHTDLGGWTEHGSGAVATLRLRRSPDVEKAGDYGLWISYYHQPRATFLHHAMDGDPSFFGRAGFRGWGARTDIVLMRGVALAVEGFDLRPAHPAAALVPMRSYHGARQRVLGMSVTAYF